MTIDELAKKVYTEILERNEHRFDGAYVGAFSCWEGYYDYEYSYVVNEYDVPAHLMDYFDIERYANDLLAYGDYIFYEVTGEEGPDFEDFTGYVFIFWG